MILHAYAPYGLKLLNTKSGREITMLGIYSHSLGSVIIADNYNHYSTEIWPFKPILRQLCELTIKDAAIAGYRTVDAFIDDIKSQHVTVKTWNKLLKEHYNVFNLPEGEYVKK